MPFKYETKGEPVPNLPGARQIGSQIRQHISYTDYQIIQVSEGEALIADTETGEREIWYLNDHHAGYTLQIGRWGYEYGRDAA